MALVNEHFLKLPNNYLFSDIAKKEMCIRDRSVLPRYNLISGRGWDGSPLPDAV